ncbi:MAG TPA: hypothetical protein VES42_18075 [Pilimelia sp.]|nr:hypothetical protein [Pilimelia sp.]
MTAPWTGPVPHADPLPGGPGLPPASAGADLLFPDQAPSWQPRITPSPPPQRGKLLLFLFVGALAGLLIFGPAGFFAGRWSAAEPAATATPTPSPTASASMPPHEAAQLAVNRGLFGGQLSAFAEPWLPFVGDCVKDTPRATSGEQARVVCEYGNVNVYFIEYRSLGDREKARFRNLAQNVDARTLTPGVGSGGERAAPSERTTGTYIEYAYALKQGATTRTVAGIWWDDKTKPVGGYLLGYWRENLVQSWEPLRDVWQRHA